MFGKRLSVLNSLICSNNGFSKAAVLKDWGEQASDDIKLAKYEPSMLHCSSLFFVCNPLMGPSVSAATCSYEAKILEKVPSEEDGVDLDLDLLEAQLQPYVEACSVQILCIWDSRCLYAPRMYAIAGEDYTHAMSYVFSDSRIESQRAVGIITSFCEKKNDPYVLDRLNAYCERLPKVNSLIEAFRLLGKSETSIEMFLAIKEPRIKAMYHSEIYQEWRLWLYGTEETSSGA